MTRVLIYAAAACLLAAASASAELVLRNITWQLPEPGAGAPRGYRPIDQWVQPPAEHPGLKPRVLVTLANRGPQPAEGGVLRYAVSARLARIGHDGKDGVWTVPFFLNERRVPRVGPNQTKEIPLNDLVLAVFLKKTFRAGFWPEELKIQLMVEPHPGEGLEERLMDRTLPVVPR